jgi:hypothetical protein
MDGIPHLHGSVARVERLADFLVLFPVVPLTDLGAVQDGMAVAAVRERDILSRCYDFTDTTSLGHDCGRFRVVWAKK